MLTASLITATVACTVLFPLLWWIGKGNRLKTALVCFVLTLPMCWLMYHYVRLPLDRWLSAIVGEGDTLFWLRTAYAPLTEEPAKLWPLLIPFVRRSITDRNIVLFAIALGGGFAIGEIFTVAGLIEAKLPEVANLPWYSLGGFINERLMTCVVHSGMTATALFAIQKAHGIVAGLAAAMSLHYIANLPVAMATLGWLGPNVAFSQTILVIWVAICAIAGFAILFRLSRADRPLESSVYGEAICPTCGSRYSRSLLMGLNFGINLRFEPCPSCKRWHWTKRVPKQNR